jgi:hypothetical protein
MLYFSDAFIDYSHALVARLVETVFVILIALGFAFIPYIRNPARRVMPSLVLCAVLVVDASWLVVRTLPSEAETNDVVLALETRVCRKAFGCSPPADINGLVAKCIQGQMEGATGLDRLARIYVHQKALEKCESLDCADFANCFDREAGLMALPRDEHRRLLRLVCEAIEDVRRRGQATSDVEASSKWTEMEQALDELHNPALAEALREEGRQKCGVTNGAQPGTGDPVRKEH